MDNLFQRRLLGALNLAAKYPRLAGPGRLSYGHIFAGIDPVEKAKRRKKGKAQRLARKAAR
ncbi:hypothetical protein SEA_JANEEMI_57 [Arthrobacter phage Janeemi]|uniref:Uncharacterized protein n=1 Tax=Arthrobacter phage Janeemi TaxID=2927240 RepID=A0A9E7TVY9_9CAUD|nr:hypothetical protein SEA_JANEEMI_57 [Arthrobacter phage Janeemi]